MTIAPVALVGPVETAWATAVATPSAGHVPFVTVLRPSVPVQPPTLFVAKAAAAGELHERANWGAAQAGLALGGRPSIDEVLAAARGGATNPFSIPGGAG